MGFQSPRNTRPQIKTSSGVIGKARGCGQLFRVEVITGHKANGALKAQDTDIAPSDIAILAIEIANGDFGSPFGQVDLLNCAGPTFESC